MMCLICSSSFLETASWRKLFFMKHPDVICEKCKSKFERNHEKVCVNEWTGTIYDGSLASIDSIYIYNEWMKQVYQQYKFQLDVELAKIFISDFKPLHQVKELIVPVPLHPDRLLERTFSQVDQLLIAANLPFTHVLAKKENRSQLGKSKKDRMTSELIFTVTADVQHQSILLVDDLYTTGTTLHHAAYALKKAGAKRVTGLTLIRA